MKKNIESSPRHFCLTKEQLLVDLYQAYKDARRNKRGKSYQLQFEYSLEDNLVRLRDELWAREYHPYPSKCFIIHEPKMREVFAAHFRDRIVHHLFYNYSHRLFERSFIYDSYSCIVGRGTHFGIDRLRHHIRSVSKGYSGPCFVLKLDISGYFMSINREILLSLCMDTINRQKYRLADGGLVKWCEIIDFDFLKYLLANIVLLDPLSDCIIIGDRKEWRMLPINKSLFHSEAKCGLPIGNLSSQLFSNVYLNKLDQFIKRDLGCRHYGRYVDDAYIVSHSKAELKALIPRLSTFLSDELKLTLQSKKTKIYDIYHGVGFLGAYLMPFRNYVHNDTLCRIKHKLMNLKCESPKQYQIHINSVLGLLSHYKCYCIRKVLFNRERDYHSYGYFSFDYLKFNLKL